MRHLLPLLVVFSVLISNGCEQPKKRSSSTKNRGQKFNTQNNKTNAARQRNKAIGKQNAKGRIDLQFATYKIPNGWELVPTGLHTGTWIVPKGSSVITLRDSIRIEETDSLLGDLKEVAKEECKATGYVPSKLTFKIDGEVAYQVSGPKDQSEKTKTTRIIASHKGKTYRFEGFSHKKNDTLKPLKTMLKTWKWKQ